MSTAVAGPRSEAEVFGRILDKRRGKMSVALARYVLNLGFEPEERARMEDLAERNQQSALSPEEAAELHAYVQAGHLLAVLHSRARKTLRERA